MRTIRGVALAAAFAVMSYSPARAQESDPPGVCGSAILGWEILSDADDAAAMRRFLERKVPPACTATRASVERRIADLESRAAPAVTAPPPVAPGPSPEELEAARRAAEEEARKAAEAEAARVRAEHYRAEVAARTAAIAAHPLRRFGEMAAIRALDKDARGLNVLGQAAAQAGRWAEAAALYTAACDFGDGLACRNGGIILGAGRTDFPKNPEAAAALYEKGCALNDAGACLGLGVAYQSGAGLPTDRAQAVEAYRRALALDPGNSDARFNLDALSAAP